MIPKGTKHQLDPYKDLITDSFETYALAYHYSRPTVRISALSSIAIRINHPVLIINSDIEIYGPRRFLLEAINRPEKTLVGGIRHNYDVWGNSEREGWGIDAFYITPDMAKSLPDLGFGIGKPMWDYWIPAHFLNEGYNIELIGEPFFYHKKHALHWNSEEWEWGAKKVDEKYGTSIQEDSKSFRRSLPWSDISDSDLRKEQIRKRLGVKIK